MKKFAYFILVLIVSAGLGLLFRTTPWLKKVPKEVKGEAVKAKAEIIFCGEKLSMERAGVKERLNKVLNTEIKGYSSERINALNNSPWFSFVEEELKTAGLPPDLRYLPIIESNLDCLATSEKGAVGLWQFTKETALDYELKVDAYVDERRDPFASTGAAKNYLRSLYSRFHNWPEALAGYNMGGDDFEKVKSKEKVADYYEVKGIPPETRDFIFRMIATKLIFENPEKYGFSKQIITRVEVWQVQKIKLIIKKKQESIAGIVAKLQDDYPNLNQGEFLVFNPHLSLNLPAGIYNVYVLEKNGIS